MAGLLLAPQGIGSLLPRTSAGKLTDRIGPQIGRPHQALVLTALGHTRIHPRRCPRPSEWVLAASLLVRGAGLAGTTIAVMAGSVKGVGADDVPDASTTSGSSSRSEGRSALRCSLSSWPMSS